MARELAMYKHLSAVVMTGSIALTIGLAATSPSAASTTTTWTVKPGGSVIAQGSVKIKDTSTGTPITCRSVALSTTLKSGSGLPGAGIGSITKATFAKCAITTGATTFTVGGLPWGVNALSYDAANGMTTGSLAGIHLHGSPLGGCVLTVDGTAASANDGRTMFTYTNSTGKLRFISGGGNLTFFVSGCFGLFNSGDHAVMTGTLAVSPKQKITSP
jgi:hypothetical protein